MSEPRRPILVVGSINMDLVALAPHIPRPGETVIGTSFQRHPGGKGANQAVAIARLGHPVQLIGRLGNDPIADELRSHLHAAGVGLQGVATSEGSSGVAVIVVSDAGENSIVVTPGANFALTPDDLDRHLDLLRAAPMVLAQLEIPLETLCHLADLCHRENIPLMLDPAPARSLPGTLLRHVTWFTPNESEAAFFLSGRPSSSHAQAAATLLADGPSGVVLKLGARGAFLAGPSHPGELLPPFQVAATDTTAAGDAFNGAFATSLCLGNPPADAVRFAAAAAAISVTRPGAQPSMPRWNEVQTLLATAKP